MPRLSKPRKKRSVRIRLDLYQWVEEQIERKRFWNFSHAVEIALEKLRDPEREEKRQIS